MRNACLMFFLAAALVQMAPMAQAREPSLLSKDFDQCMAKSEGVTAAMQDCNGQEWQRQDKRLNAAYKRLMAKLPAAKKSALQSVQRAWLKYAEAKCAFYWDADEFNGTLDRLNAAICGTEERARRAQELEQFADR